MNIYYLLKSLESLKINNIHFSTSRFIVWDDLLMQKIIYIQIVMYSNNLMS